MIIIGDAKTELKNLESKSVNCCVTSPPYFGLRDYGHEDQIGLEPTPGEYVKNILEVFQETKRVLRDDGTLWLNLGDSYAGNGGHKDLNNIGDKQLTNSGSLGNSYRTPGKIGLKPKDLIGIPWKVAFALQVDGWYLRQDIIWNKPNAMPESIKDRCTKSHEYIFLFSKSEKYYFDYEAIKEPVCSGKGNNKSFRGGGNYTQGRSFDNSCTKEKETIGNTHDRPQTRNKRSVWTIEDHYSLFNFLLENNPGLLDQYFAIKSDVWSVATNPYKGAHFATFPPELIKPCILAGCPEGGIVIDPFFGSGTVGEVAKDSNRDYIGIELNPEYEPLIHDRCNPDQVRF